MQRCCLACTGGQIAERIDARLSQTEKSHKSVIAARKSAKGAKNRKWLQRVKVTKAMPDSRSVATEARIRAKYQKIEDRKKAAQALQRHKKMLQDKLKFQQEQWRKEYNPAQGLKKPTHVRNSLQPAVQSIVCHLYLSLSLDSLTFLLFHVGTYSFGFADP